MPRNPLLGFQNPTAYAVAFKNIPEKNRRFVPLKKYLHGFLEEMLRDKKLSIRLSEEIKSTNSSFFPVSASIVKTRPNFQVFFFSSDLSCFTQFVSLWVTQWARHAISLSLPINHCLPGWQRGNVRKMADTLNRWEGSFSIWTWFYEFSGYWITVRERTQRAVYLMKSWAWLASRLSLNCCDNSRKSGSYFQIKACSLYAPVITVIAFI